MSECLEECACQRPCCEPHGYGGCEDSTCEARVCSAFPECCLDEWTDECVEAAEELCSYRCGQSDCFEVIPRPGCEDGECEALVCEEDPTCCTTEWTATCVDHAETLCVDDTVCEDDDDCPGQVCSDPGTDDARCVDCVYNEDCGSEGAVCEEGVRWMGPVCIDSACSSGLRTDCAVTDEGCADSIDEGCEPIPCVGERDCPNEGRKFCSRNNIVRFACDRWETGACEILTYERCGGDLCVIDIFSREPWCYECPIPGCGGDRKEICHNRVDDDRDGTIDEGCPPPRSPPGENCGNGVDDDGDGLADCADPDCSC